MEKVNIVWHRLGKEHGEGQGLRKNDAGVVRSHLQAKIDQQRKVPAADWRWWKVDESRPGEVS